MGDVGNEEGTSTVRPEELPATNTLALQAAAATQEDTSVSEAHSLAPSLSVQSSSNPDLRVQVWPALICCTDGPTLDSNYLIDSCVPWSEEASCHVFVPGSVKDVKEATKPLSPKEREDIIQAVVRRFLDRYPKARLEQPMVYFDGQKIHISALDVDLLQDLWKRPPLVDGTPLRLISKGFPWAKATTYAVEGTAAMKQSNLTQRVAEEIDDHTKAVIAYFHHVHGLSGESVFNGRMLVIATDSWYDKRTFMGQRCSVLKYKTVLADSTSSASAVQTVVSASGLEARRSSFTAAEHSYWDRDAEFTRAYEYRRFESRIERPREPRRYTAAASSSRQA